MTVESCAGGGRQSGVHPVAPLAMGARRSDQRVFSFRQARVMETNSTAAYPRYQQLQRYVNWTERDAAHVHALKPLVRDHFVELVDDFYAEIENHPEARRVITGGEAQIARLKQTLRGWLEELFSGNYDQAYVERRWRVGLRHVEIGLNQVYTNAALSRLRRGLLNLLQRVWTGPAEEAINSRAALNTLLDLDLALSEDAYQTEYQRRQAAAERLATIGKVAGGIAHELRNPLNVVKTSVYFLMNAKNASPEKIKSHLQRIERQVEVADGVITALNDFARLPIPQLEPVEVEPCLKDIVEVITLPGNIRIEWSIDSPTPTVLADRRQLQIVLSNLIRNARDAMPQGGKLRLAATQQGHHTEIVVQDDGVGISPENVARILEPLYSTKAKGIGLGLSITSAILARHHGTLHISSEPGQGAIFTIRLPSAN
jgi:signal transduction histidine kinase